MRSVEEPVPVAKSNEEEELIYINHEETFELHKEVIRQKRSEYVHREADEFEKACQEQTERAKDDDIDDANIEYDQDKMSSLYTKQGLVKAISLLKWEYILEVKKLNILMFLKWCQMLIMSG